MKNKKWTYSRWKCGWKKELKKDTFWRGFGIGMGITVMLVSLTSILGEVVRNL